MWRQRTWASAGAQQQQRASIQREAHKRKRLRLSVTGSSASRSESVQAVRAPHKSQNHVLTSETRWEQQYTACFRASLAGRNCHRALTEGTHWQSCSDAGLTAFMIWVQMWVQM